MRRIVLLAALTVTSACAGGMAMLPGEDNQRVEVAGDVYFVRVQGSDVLVRNLATGINNQNRLFDNAQTAITQLTGCPFTRFQQLPDLNSYTATLACDASPSQNG